MSRKKAYPTAISIFGCGGMRSGCPRENETVTALHDACTCKDKKIRLTRRKMVSGAIGKPGSKPKIQKSRRNKQFRT